jgi:hypothetical protein
MSETLPAGYFTKAKLQSLEMAFADKRLTHLDVRVLGRLWTKYYNKKLGYAFPSIERLAKDVGANERSVQHSIRRLEDCDYLTTFSGGGRRKTNHYELHLPSKPRPGNMGREATLSSSKNRGREATLSPASTTGPRRSPTGGDGRRDPRPIAARQLARTVGGDHQSR